MSRRFPVSTGQGHNPESPETAAVLAAVFHALGAAANNPAVKDRLPSNTEAAAAAGVFGVPTLAIG